MLWAGGKGKALNQSADESQAGYAVSKVLLILGAILTFLCITAPIGIILFVIGFILFVKNSDSGCYALTDERLLILLNNEFYQISLRDIKETTVSSNGKGSQIYISLVLTEDTIALPEIIRRPNVNPQEQGQKNMAILFGIKDTLRVKRVIDDAVLDATTK